MGVGESGRRYFEKHRLRPLQFRNDQGRLTGLRTLLLVYPSPKLAEIADPLTIFAEHDGVLSYEVARATVAERLRPALDALRESARTDDGDALPEWAAPAVIDQLLGAHAVEWLTASDGMSELASEDAFHEHVVALGDVAAEHGDVPDDLLDLLVDVALGSPAVCALRALHRIAPSLVWDDPQLLGAAAGVAWAFRTLFNQQDRKSKRLNSSH